MPKLLRNLFAVFALSSLICLVPSAWSADDYGKLSGVVLDPAGTPQMGATIWLSADVANDRAAIQLFSDQEGVFAAQRLRPGIYSVKVTLAGFLPSIQQHVRISANLTTLLHIELDSVFASLDQLRRKPEQSAEIDDWKWVLRSSASTRPVLQLVDGTVVVADDESSNLAADGKQPRGRVEMTNGSSYPGSPSALPGYLTTAISYDQALGAAGRLLIAGQMINDQLPGDLTGAPDGGLASIWLPSGQFGRGPQTTVVMRQARVAPGGPTVRTMRIEHSEQLSLSARSVVEYGAEYVMGGGAGATSSAVRPRARVGMQLSPHWAAALLLETDPGSYSLRTRTLPLEFAIDALGTLPTLLWRDGRAALQGGWHEEFAVKRTVGRSGSVEAATFYDYSGHQAVFGFNADQPYALDAGAGGSLGTRAVYRETLSPNVEVSGIYAWAGALAPNGRDFDLPSNLNAALVTRYRHSVAGRLSGNVPRTGTQLTASYKWLSGIAVSRQDLYGEAGLGVDPYLSVTIRQRLPSFRTSGHWEALVDFRNLLAQGYVPGDQNEIILAPVERSFRGGVSFQF